MAQEGVSECYLERRFEGTVTRIDLPQIESIDDTIDVKLTEIPTLIYGVDERFVMDLGTSQKYSVVVTRVNPMGYNDASSDPEQWSNGRWYARLRDLFDFWQNLSEDSKGDYVGGVRFVFRPESWITDEFYPEIDKRVFLSGSISASFGVQTLRLELPLQVARMQGAEETVKYVTGTYNCALDSDSFALSYREGALGMLPSPPSSWANRHAMAFEGWYNGSVRYQPGESYRFDSDTTFEGRWKEPLSIEKLTQAGYHSITVPDGASRVTAYIVGAGGGCGGTRFNRTGSQASLGGGGSSGAVLTPTFDVTAGNTINVHVGQGGLGGAPVTQGGVAYDHIRGKQGQNGEDSTVTYRDTTYSAKGGEGGMGGNFDGTMHTAGGLSVGEGSYPGGSVRWGEAGSDGKTSDTAPKGYPGKGLAYDTSSELLVGGGCGGGASALDLDIHEGTMGTRYVSRGGDAISYRGVSEANVWTGGGAGSAVDSDQARGADGLVVLMFM